MLHPGKLAPSFPSEGNQKVVEMLRAGYGMAGQVSVNDFIIRAVALALVDVPRANSQWDSAKGEIVPCPSVDISIAVATDKGLITPIVKHADQKSLTQISAEVVSSSRRTLQYPSLGRWQSVRVLSSPMRLAELLLCHDWSIYVAAVSYPGCSTCGSA